LPGTGKRPTRRRRAPFRCAPTRLYYRPILAYAVRRVTPAEDAADGGCRTYSPPPGRRIDELPQAPADRLVAVRGGRSGSSAGRRRSARRLLRLTARLRADGRHPATEASQDRASQEPGEPGVGQPGVGQAGNGASRNGASPGLRDANGRTVSSPRSNRLSAGEREALQLVLWEELSHAEAAQVLGCSANGRGDSACTGPRRGCAASCPPPNCLPPSALAPSALATGMSEPRSVPETTTPHPRLDEQELIMDLDMLVGRS